MNEKLIFGARSTVVGLALVTATGCVDFEAAESADFSASTHRQAVSVVPEFHIRGADEIPDTLYLTNLGLVVSEIRLTPVIHTDTGLAYSTANPITLKFDIQNDQFVQQSEALELPDPGSYVVSIRLEPIAKLDGEDQASSFSLDGFVAEAPKMIDFSRAADGTPLPLPFDEKPTDDELTDRHDNPLVWTPFEYNSQRTVSYTYSVVELSRGQQVLEFSFDVRAWAGEVADPISTAIRNSIEAEEDGVDVTRQIESRGVGIDSLIEAGVVRTEDVPR